MATVALASGLISYVGTALGPYDQTWQMWNQSITTAATNVQYYQQTWANWNQQFGTATISYSQPITSQDQWEAARLAVAQEDQKQKLIKERAKAILYSMLTPEQREEYEFGHSFHLQVGKTWYRIGRGLPVYQVKEHCGKALVSYCIHPRVDLPIEDIHLGQKLLLESNEKEFLKIANATRMAA
jgi:hypothetical protein